MSGATSLSQTLSRSKHFNGIQCHVEHFAYCQSRGSAWLYLHKALLELGFSQCNYIKGIVSETAEPLITTLGSYDEGYLNDYLPIATQGDCAMLWALSHDDPLVWDTPQEKQFIDQYLKTKKEFDVKKHQVVEDLTRDYQMENGVSIPLNGATGCYGGMGISAVGVKQREFQRDVLPRLDELKILVSLFDSAVKRFPAENGWNLKLTEKALTSREIEVLKYLTEGFTLKEIADEKLHRSLESVNIYVREAKLKLQARTRDQLVARALMLNIL